MTIKDEGLSKMASEEDVLTIEDGVVTACKEDAERIVIPAGVTRLGSGFSASEKLKEVVFEGTMAEWENIKYSYKVFIYGDVKCVKCADGEVKKSVYIVSGDAVQLCIDRNVKNVTVEGVKKINPRVFRQSEVLEHLVIGEGVTEIGDGAFLHCSSLKSVSLPSTLKKIGKDAFDECYSVEKIESASPLFKFDEEKSTLYYVHPKKERQPILSLKKELHKVPESFLTIENGVVTKCHESAVSVVIPDGVTAIGENAFNKCESLKSVVIPESVREIGKCAFHYCEALESVVIPKGVTAIGNCAFANCTRLKEVVIPEGVTEISYCAFEKCSALEEVTIPESVTSIVAAAFNNCSSLKSVVIPNGVKQIESWTFKNCASLEQVTIPEGVVQIGMEAFCCCSSLKSIVLPNSLTAIGEQAFDNCTSLSSVTFGDKITEIAPFSFMRCESLKSIEIPSTVSEIGVGVFADCTALSGIVIPEGVTKIGKNAFYKCTALSSIEIPSTMAKIEKDAFEDCEAVEKIVSKSPMFPFNEKTRKLYAVTKTTKNAILSLGKDIAKQAKIDEVQNASASAVLESILSEHKSKNKVVRGEKSASLLIKASFGGIEILLLDSKVQKWMKTLPSLLDLAATGADAFALKKFADENALEDKSRKYLTISKNDSVSRKKKLKPVYFFIPDGVTSIEGRTFSFTETLKFTAIPSTVTEIGGTAFEECTFLTEIAFGGTVAQWNAVKKGKSWCKGIGAKSVQCTDGEVEIEVY
ncbi:leucine-rich repeat domain-containing protein [Treponema saccharophilum]|nr:leucine-rich repeat domain-containing protein [Treponema saccharophilum]